MPTTAIERVAHVKDAISGVREVLDGMSFDEAESSRVVWPAFQRYLEILSEASRHIPAAWKAEHGSDVPWQQIAHLGDRLRHAYQRVEAPILWAIYLNDLDPLEAAIDRMLAAHGEP